VRLPFTIEQFLDVFRKYNSAVWPIQIVFILLAMAAIYFSFRKRSYTDKIIVITLTFFWHYQRSNDNKKTILPIQARFTHKPFNNIPTAIKNCPVAIAGIRI